MQKILFNRLILNLLISNIMYSYKDARQCAQCGAELSSDCANASELNIDNNPLCQECNHKKIVELLVTAQFDKMWLLVRTIIFLVCTPLGLFIYYSFPKIDTWGIIIAYFGCVVIAWNLFSSMANSTMRVILTIIVGPYASPFLLVKNILEINKKNQLIEEYKELELQAIHRYGKTVGLPAGDVVHTDKKKSKSSNGLVITLVIILLVAVGGYWAYRNFNTSRIKKTHTELSDAIPPYYCNTATLNIRAQGSTNAEIVGKLSQGEVVYVYSIDETTNFAKIEFNGSIAYASADFLLPVAIGSMTGWKAMALAGRVEKITYPNGDYVMFDRNGNITEEKNGEYTSTRLYEHPRRYRRDQGASAWNITFTDSKRMEVDEDNSWMEYRIDFEFDNLGRVSSQANTLHHTIHQSKTYVYNNNGFLPYQIVHGYSDEYGNSVTTETYTYTETDKQGNWLKCNVHLKMEGTWWDEESDSEKKSVETDSKRMTRTIAYYRK